MGQFSWIYSDTNKQVMNSKIADTFLLVPDQFQKKYGKFIYESCYDGYGRFGNYDVYELILEWNKEVIPEILRRIKNKTWLYSTNNEDRTNLLRYYKDKNKEITCELRHLGIIMACFDNDNFALEHPIKITSKQMNYKRVKPSKTDPNHGWKF